MTLLAIYGAIHLFIGVVTLLTVLCREMPGHREDLAPLPRIVWNAFVIVTCWPAVWFNR